MIAHPLPRAAEPPSTWLLLAGLAAVALAVAILSTYALVALHPGLADPPGPGGTPSSPPASPVPTASPTPPPTPTPTTSPTTSPIASPTPVPTLVPVPTVAPTPAPTPPGTGNALPPCAYLDLPTPHDGYDAWRITLLDTIYRLPASYAPGDLVDSGAAGVNGGYAIRRVAVDDLRAMAEAARTAGAPIALVSGYRSHAQQQATFDYWVSVGGYDQALRTSARAGHSEHQLGTAIDVTSEGGAAPWEYADWAATAAGAWMTTNAWRYGFVMSYPRGAFDLACYDYEPWHYRYVGRELAAEIHASGRVPRQVIWELQ